MSSPLQVEQYCFKANHVNALKQTSRYSQRIYDQRLVNEADEIRNLIQQELKRAIQPVDDNWKSYYKAIHTYPKEVALLKHQKWVSSAWRKYHTYFANPQEIFPNKISPKLELIETQKQRDLFRIARLTWNLPYSSGYGRRLNYLIWDTSNNKLIGILGLQSPPLSLPARDKKYNIPTKSKDYIVNLTMDAFTLGALPPYSELLAGKLVVLAAASKEVRRDYRKRYLGCRTRMLGRVLPSNLVAVTTLSAFGRSSLYNRVSKGIHDEESIKILKHKKNTTPQKGDNIWATESLGPCQGWGTIHFSDALYEKMKTFHQSLLPEKQLSGFGIGPKIRQQVISRVLQDLRLPETLTHHNIKREVFVISHVENLEDILSGESRKPVFNDKPFKDLAEYWKERYCLPRAESRCSIEGKDSIADALRVEHP